MPSFDLKLLRSIKTGKGLIKLILNLRQLRRDSKVQEKRQRLTSLNRKHIFDKTGGRCHLCGIPISLVGFHADHVQTLSSGGKHELNNYLPSCGTCNTLRWHYSPEELQIILKLGRWMKTKLLEDKEEANSLADQFVKHDMQLRKRRKGNN